MAARWKGLGVVGLLMGILLSGCAPDVESSTEEEPHGEEREVQPEPVSWEEGEPRGSTPEPASPPRVVTPEPEVPPAAPGTPATPGSRPAPPSRFTYAPLQTTVEQYTVELDPKLLARFYQDENTPPQSATFLTPDGRRLAVKLRLRGNSSRGWPKKSWRIELPKGTRFDGRRKLNLISEWRDSTMMLEKLGYDMLEAMGVPAPRGRYVRLVINGEYQGVYLDLERVDRNFLRNHDFADQDGTIYRCGRKNCELKLSYDHSYQRDWVKQTNEKQPDDALRAFLRTVNRSPEPRFARALEERFELEHYLRTLVADALISNSTVEDSRSYLVHDAVTGRFSYVAWDFNNTDAKYIPFGSRKRADYKHPLFNFSLFDSRVEEAYEERAEEEPGRWKPIFSNLNTRIVLNPELRERALVLVEQGLDELFAPEVIHARIRAIHALLAPHMGGAPHTDLERFADGPRYLEQYVSNRTAFLRKEVAGWRNRKPGLVLQAVDARAGWIELRNRGTQPVSTAGLVLTTNLREATRPNVPARLLAPGETVRLTQGELGLRLEPEGEVGLFNGKSALGLLDALFYGASP